METPGSSVAARRSFPRLWVTLALIPPLVVGVGLAVAPDVFYDHYVWRDIYGPLLVDARGWSGACLHPDGSVTRASPTTPTYDTWWERLTQPSRTAACSAEAVGAVDGYTPMSEATYGFVLAVMLGSIYVGIFKRYTVRTDASFVFALAPYILLGPVSRVLEDADVFQRADGAGPGLFAVLFISPVIYLHIAVYTIAFLVLGVVVAERERRALSRGTTLTIVGAALAAEVLGYLAVTTRWPGEFTAAASPAVVALAALAAYAYFYGKLRAGRAGVNETLLAGGIPLIAPAADLVLRWLAGDAWLPGAAVFLPALWVVLALAGGTTLALLVLFYLVKRVKPAAYDRVRPYFAALGIAIIFGHLLDGFATYVALIDPFEMGNGLGTYGEKHPVSAVFLGIAGGLGFPAVKLLLVLYAVWLLDKESKRGTADEARLVGLIAMAVFVLGFAPGLRDTLRLAMGV